MLTDGWTDRWTFHHDNSPSSLITALKIQMVYLRDEDMKRFGLFSKDAQSWRKWRRKIKGPSG